MYEIVLRYISVRPELAAAIFSAPRVWLILANMPYELPGKYKRRDMAAPAAKQKRIDKMPPRFFVWEKQNMIEILMKNATTPPLDPLQNNVVEAIVASIRKTA